MAKKSNNELFSALLYILVGVVLVIFRAQTLGWAMTIAGAFFIVSGILDVMKKNFAGGAVSLVIGLVILVLGWTAIQIVLLVFGILITIKGAIALYGALQIKRKRALDILFPILTIVTGLLLAFGNGLDLMIVAVGILMIVDGVVGLVGARK